MPGELLIIDNYDSFTYNLVQLFARLGSIPLVHRNDCLSLQEVREIDPAAILISPGPRFPQRSGISLDIVRAFAGQIPILGVCLGMQCLNEHFGGSTRRAPYPIHGKTSPVRHTGRGLLRGMPNPFRAARYHSLVACPAPGSPLRVDAVSEGDEAIMALTHPELLLFGVQFHPESFLTSQGERIAESFLERIPVRMKTS
jgi:anthranilate synthase component 2